MKHRPPAIYILHLLLCVCHLVLLCLFEGTLPHTHKHGHTHTHSLVLLLL